MVKMKTIALATIKGGVAKTTVATNLAYELSLLGKRVLLIDLDPQAHASLIFCKDIPKELSIGQIFERDKVDINKIIRPALLLNSPSKEIPNLDIISSSIHLAFCAEATPSRFYREKILKTSIDTLEGNWDYCLIDCPPTLGILLVNALFAANHIIIPTTYGRYALEGIIDLLNSIAEIKAGVPYVFNVLRTMYDKRNSQTNSYIEEQLLGVTDHLFKTIIHKSESINQSQINSLPVSVFSKESIGAQNFKELAIEVVSHE
jgi:chromosome partitioning protein